MKKNLKLFLAVFFIGLNLQIFSQSIDDIPEEIAEQIEGQLLERVENNNLEVSQPEIIVDVNPSGILTKNKRFGFDFFNSNLDQSSSSFDIPLQADYQISFGDKLELLLIGSQNENYKLDVDLSGNIFVPEIGKISVKDLTLDQAEKKVSEIIEKAYIGVESFLTVTDAALKKVSVIGAVKRPGTFIVNPFISLSESLKYAEGLLDEASIRTLIVRDFKGNKKEYDLYDFLIFGDRQSDVNLRNGDTVIVQSTSSFISISGEVHRPYEYEYLESDTYKSLIDFAQGLTLNSNKDSIKVNYLDDNFIRSKNVAAEDLIGKELLLELNIGSKSNINKKDFLVKGGAVSTGYYKFTKGSSLSDFLDNLDFTDNHYPFFAIFEQTNDIGLIKEKFYLSPSDSKTYANILLKDNPTIEFFTREDVALLAMNDEEINEISDDVEIVADAIERKKILSEIIPRRLIVNIRYENLNKPYPIVGRVQPNQILNHIGFSNYLDNEVIVITKTTTEQNTLDKFYEGDNLNSIYFPTAEKDLISVLINGKISSPGSYQVPFGTKLNDLFEIAGGIKGNKNIGSVIITRESAKEREKLALQSSRKVLKDLALQQLSNSAAISNSFAANIDLSSIVALSEEIELVGRIAGDYLPNTPSSERFVLQEGDEIFVTSELNTVSVFGEVSSPTTTSHNPNHDFNDYIKIAGDFTDYADERKAYLIRANGESIPLSNKIFSEKIEIRPGDTIIVPRNLSKLDALPLVSVATQIISDIAFSAASLNVLKD